MQFFYLSINHNTIITAFGLRPHTIFNDELSEQCASEVGAAIYAVSGTHAPRGQRHVLRPGSPTRWYTTSSSFSKLGCALNLVELSWLAWV